MSSITVLVVDDDIGDVKAVKRAFAKNKRIDAIHYAVDGIEALQLLRGQNTKEKLIPPYILLVDINMPRMNGIELIKELRKDKELHRTIVFMLTTSKREEDKIASYDLNVAGYIVKEKAGEDFLNLTALIHYYELIVELPS
ncbi:MAG: Response regulator receiver [uncultured bacterium]|nr:MAG: Response regulator receiver [uncultured bacterium]